MEVTIFIYNIFLIILCSIVLTLSGFYYLKTKNKCYFGIIVLFSLYLFNNIVVYTTEFIKTFSLSYNNLFISIPTYKTLILISILAAYIMINNIFLNLFLRKNKRNFSKHVFNHSNFYGKYFLNNLFL